MASWFERNPEDPEDFPVIDGAVTSKRRKSRFNHPSPAEDATVERPLSNDAIVVRQPWRALSNARFIPSMKDRQRLLESLLTLSTYGHIYEWLRSVIFTCAYVVPGNMFHVIKMDTIAIIMKMVDPDDICGENVDMSSAFRRTAIWATALLGNVAGALICQWDTTPLDDKEYYPTDWDENEIVESHIPFQAVEAALPEGHEPLYDAEGHALCTEHGPDDLDNNCPYCQYRKNTLISSAQLMGPVCRGPGFTTQLVYHPLDLSNPGTVPIDGASWLAIQVGFEGVRLVHDENGPLTRWRSNLREHYSYLVLLHEPSLVTNHADMKDWTGDMFITKLREFQDKGNVNMGFIPASVYKAAIEHYSSIALQNPVEEKENRIDTNVERFGLRPILTCPDEMRQTAVVILSDSGSFIYNANLTFHKSVDEFLKSDKAVAKPWPDLKGFHGCGAGWTTWTEGLKSIYKYYTEQGLLETAADKVKRVPACYQVICIDNLNSVGALIPKGEIERLECKKLASRKPLTTLEGFLANERLVLELEHLLTYLSLFKSAVYVRTAPAKRWQMPEEVDRISIEINSRATLKQVVTIKGESFWDSVVHFAHPKSNYWHHGQQGNDGALHYHWDRFIFRVVCFCRVGIIHPATLGSICDFVEYDKIYQEIRRNEASDGFLATAGAPLSATAEALDLIPASDEYDATNGRSSATGKPLWSEDAPDEDPQVKSELPDWEEEEGNEANPQFSQEEEAQADPLPWAEDADHKAIMQCMSNLDYIVDFRKTTYCPGKERVFTVDVTTDDGPVCETYILPPWAEHSDTGKCSFCEHRLEFPDFENMPRPIFCSVDYCMGHVQIAADVSVRMADAANSFANIAVIEAGRKHVQKCKADFEFRKTMANTAGKTVPPGNPGGSADFCLNETFGYDHNGLEGFNSYEESLRKALADEVNSLKKKTSLVQDAPVPRNLQEMKDRDQAIALAQAAEAEAEIQRAGAIAAKAKAKARPHSKGSTKAVLEPRIIEKGAQFADAAKSIVVKSSGCTYLGQAVMHNRMAHDRRQPVLLPCYDVKKIDFDAVDDLPYIRVGIPYDQILKRVGGPIFAISDELLPEPKIIGATWPVVYGNHLIDNTNNKYKECPYHLKNWSDRDKAHWKTASRVLGRALRHPPYRGMPRLRVQADGWASILDCTRFLAEALPLEKPPVPWGTLHNFICSVNWIFGLVLEDEKSRFQLAGVTDSYGIRVQGSYVASFEYIRATSGHSGHIASLVRDEAAYVRLEGLPSDDISILCHKPKKENICSIMYQGLKPGGVAGVREHVNLSPFLPHDPRNVSVGRPDPAYDTVIMFDKQSLFRDDFELLMSKNGVVVTTRPMTWQYIHLLYILSLKGGRLIDGFYMIRR